LAWAEANLGDPSGGSVIDVAELERAVKAADPEAFLIPPRILRRVIKRDRGLTFFGFHAARRESYVISGAALRAIVAEDELGLRPGDPWPGTAILLARPDPEDLADADPAQVRLEFWRRLYHARVHAAVDHRFAAGELGAADLRARIERIGPVAFDEIRAVLRNDGAILPPRDDRTVYTEFAACYLVLSHFAPALLAHTFPAIDRRPTVEAVLALDVDGKTLLARTRLPGAADPRIDPRPVAESERSEFEMRAFVAPPETLVPEQHQSRGLERRAESAGSKGNVVRAAILRTRAAPVTGPTRLIAAWAEINRLVQRLQSALGFDDEEAERWSQALPPLLEHSTGGFWTPEARLLYDLQKVCVDHEREVFRTDLIGWALSFGRRPVRRPLPHLREVMISSHLRGAFQKLQATRLGRVDRKRLSALLAPAVRRAEDEVRRRFRPTIEAVLASTGLQPRNLPERVAHGKLIEELLDRIVGRGFLTLGDLRDACSRSNLKLPDLTNPVEFLRGDRLLQTDQALAHALEGVYRQGEIYLRWLQRMSALAFGTPLGRFLTRYAALPYGGAYIVLKGLEHLIELLAPLLFRVDVHLNMVSFTTVAMLGTVALGMINFAAFRRGFLAAMRWVGRHLHTILVAWPTRLLAIPLFRWLLASRAATILWRFLIKPLIATLPVWLFGPRFGLDRQALDLSAAGFFLLATLLLNSRFGRDAEEILADEAVRAWRQLWLDFVPGLFRLVLQTFDRILETVERLLYAVDEWLRFRSGQSALILAIKAVLGLFWFVIAYMVRIYVNLLIEPQVNPIKHFPVVTVSHKIILPLSGHLIRLLKAPLIPLVGQQVGVFIAGTTVLLLPGIFGFLVWELKENWRLYEANRSPALKPVLVGEHGETMQRLLRPGFHSGTLPKLFSRLRKAERRALRGGRDQKALKYAEALHHFEESIHRFIDRDFLALAHASRSLGTLGMELRRIDLATNRIRVELCAPGLSTAGPGLSLAFEQRGDWLVASIEDPGWLPDLPEPLRRVLTTAIAGLYKMCGVDAVRVEDLPEAIGNVPFERATPDEPAPPAEPGITPFKPIVVTWRRWVDAWEKDQAGARPPMRVIEGIALLPRHDRPHGRRRRPSGRGR
jgi:hypothetical protein